MVSTTLLFSCVASFAQVAVSEPGPVQAGVILHGLSDSTSGASFVHIQSLLSQHITDLSALLNNFTNGVNTPVRGTGNASQQVILQSASTDSPTTALACDCSSPSPGAGCQIICGNHGGSGGADPPSEAALLPDSNGMRNVTPIAELLPLRLSCSCTPPIPANCKILCANHGGGTEWQPPNEAKLASNQAPLTHQTHLSDHDSTSPQERGCDCNHPTSDYQIICGNHGGGGDNPPEEGSDHTHLTPELSQHARSSCDCSNPTSQCQNLCANHGGRINGSDDIKANPNPDTDRQNTTSSMAWPPPATDELDETTTPENQSSSNNTMRKLLTVQTPSGATTTVNADIDLSCLASFASHSAVTKLGFGGDVVGDFEPITQQSQSESVFIYNSNTYNVIGTVTLLLSDYNLHEVFYVIKPIISDSGSGGGADTSRTLPDLIVGVDFLQQIGGLTVKSALLV